MQKTKIAVIGAGIMGLCTVQALLQVGLNTIDVWHKNTINTKNTDQPKTAANANIALSTAPAISSALAGGMLAPFCEIEHLPGIWHDVAIEGLSFWKKNASNLSLGLCVNGSLIIAHPEDNYMLERFVSHLPKKLQKPKNIFKTEPLLAEKFPSGIVIEEEAHLCPLSTLHSLYEKALENNVGFHNAEKTPEELKLHYDWIIDCSGINAQKNLSTLRGVKGEMLLVHNDEFHIKRPVRLMHPRYPLYIIPRKENTFMIGATQIESEDNTDITLKSAMELMSALYSLHPSFAYAKLLSLQAGIRPAFPNNLPKIHQKDNVLYANGLFRHGYLLAPMIASAIADTCIEKKNKYETLFN